MPFVKLDCGILNSTIWIDLVMRNVFITALLLAEPREFTKPIQQVNVNSLEFTGFSAPPGWYGFVPASGIGIIRRAEVETEIGMEALRRLGEPEAESRSAEHNGRRMIRCDGGYLILNYEKYREKDYTAAARQKRYRENKMLRRDSNNVTRDANNVTRNITQAEAEAEAEEQKQPLREKVKSPSAQKQETYEPDSYMAAKAFGELAGFNGNQNLYIAKQAMETYRRRKPQMPMQDIPQAILDLWREYDAMEVHGKVSMKTFLGELGRFLDSDSWRKKEKAPQAPKPQNGHKPANPTPEWAFRKPQ